MNEKGEFPLSTSMTKSAAAVTSAPDGDSRSGNQQLVTAGQTAITGISPKETKGLWSSKLSEGEVSALAIVGHHLQLSPALGHLKVLGGNLYVTLIGYLAIAQRHPMFEGIEGPVPVTTEERNAMMIAETDHAWKAQIWRKDKKFPFLGYGRANAKNVKLFNAGDFDYLMEMAQNRAVRRALKLAFLIDVPESLSVEDVNTDPRFYATVKDPTWDKPPLPAGPDWPQFWTLCKEAGADQDEVHAILGIESIADFDGTLDDALAKVRWAKSEQKIDPRQRALDRREEATDPLFMNEPPPKPKSTARPTVESITPPPVAKPSGNNSQTIPETDPTVRREKAGLLSDFEVEWKRSQKLGLSLDQTVKTTMSETEVRARLDWLTARNDYEETAQEAASMGYPVEALPEKPTRKQLIEAKERIDRINAPDLGESGGDLFDGTEE